MEGTGKWFVFFFLQAVLKFILFSFFCLCLRQGIFVVLFALNFDVHIFGEWYVERFRFRQLSILLFAVNLEILHESS